MKLVDSLAEQEELESILEASKPGAPAVARQHYLLSTPFRYPSPLPSRFRPAGALGVWYGAESVETACTELAYWRWRFLMDSEGLRDTELIAEFSLFRAKVNGSAVDLSIHPWDARRSDWTSDDYSACLALAVEARRREVQWIRYWSARDVAGLVTNGQLKGPAQIYVLGYSLHAELDVRLLKIEADRIAAQVMGGHERSAAADKRIDD